MLLGGRRGRGLGRSARWAPSPPPRCPLSVRVGLGVCLRRGQVCVRPKRSDGPHPPWRPGLHVGVPGLVRLRVPDDVTELCVCHPVGVAMRLCDCVGSRAPAWRSVTLQIKARRSPPPSARRRAPFSCSASTASSPQRNPHLPPAAPASHPISPLPGLPELSPRRLPLEALLGCPCSTLWRCRVLRGPLSLPDLLLSFRLSILLSAPGARSPQLPGVQRVGTLLPADARGSRQVGAGGEEGSTY